MEVHIQYGECAANSLTFTQEPKRVLSVRFMIGRTVPAGAFMQKTKPNKRYGRHRCINVPQKLDYFSGCNILPPARPM